MNPEPRDRGDVIVGWLTKVTLVLVVFGVIAFDGVSVGVARIGAADTAAQAALSGAESWRQSHDIQAAYNAALSYAREHSASIRPEDFRIAPDGTVSVTVTRDATTLLLYRSKSTRKWAHVEATGSGKSL